MLKSLRGEPPLSSEMLGLTSSSSSLMSPPPRLGVVGVEGVEGAVPVLPNNQNNVSSHNFALIPGKGNSNLKIFTKNATKKK